MTIAADKNKGYATGAYSNRTMNKGLTSRPFHKALGGASTRKPTSSKVTFRTKDNEPKQGYAVAFDVLTKQVMVCVGRIAKSFWTVPVESITEVTYSDRAEGEQFFDYIPWDGRKVKATDWE